MTSTIPSPTADAAVRFRNQLDNPYASTLGERVHLAGDAGYDAARTPWNLAVDLRPAAVARPHSAEEVAMVVRAATSVGLRIAPQSTGHGASGLEQHDLSDVVLVKLDELIGVSVDPSTMRARVLGGTLWRDVVAEAAPYGLTALHGSAGDVAVAGYLLGGGLSFYGRQHGLANSSLRSIELVTATGRLVHASPTENPDLFWAARGAGGNVGVVVSLEIDLLPYDSVYAGMLLWPVEEAPQVARAWRDWCATAPESATTSLRLLRFPPLPQLPPFLAGRALIVIDGAVLEPDETAAELLAPLRALSPEMDTFGRIPAAGLLEVHMDPPGPTPAVSDHATLHSLPDEAIDTMIASAAENGVFCAELRQLGGALSTPDPAGGAVSHAPGEFALYAIAMAPTPELAEIGMVSTAAVRQSLAAWDGPTVLPTFCDRPVESFGSDWDRLRQVVANADPLGVLVANHPVC